MKLQTRKDILHQFGFEMSQLNFYQDILYLNVILYYLFQIKTQNKINNDTMVKLRANLIQIMII